LDEERLPLDETIPRQPDEEPDRLAQPVDDEQPPRLPFPVVGIGASAGGLEAVGEFLDAMRPDGGMAFVLIQHLPPDRESHMAEILARRTAMPVAQVEDGMAVAPDHLYVIRPGRLLTIHDGRLHLGPRLGTPRAANRPIDDFFKSLAEEQRERALCIVMSGMGSNGAAGAQAVKAVGGLCVAQDPETAQFPSMPQHLIDSGYADYVLRPADIPEVLLAYAGHPYARGGREADAEVILERERQHLREILAVLRTRSRKDFSGYKKPTLLRRVQRRMGLARTTSMGEYAKLMRQSPAEVTALADDLLIHVTGFFRDPEAWEALRGQVIAPLVASREPGGLVRAWVTACSSGEEAYSLAMLLVEEADRAGKSLDIKVFATDLADRALAHARAGVYPGGIESEIVPERLDRFFARDDANYRVNPVLRDRVVFAPQNILQDPPFSRLDIASCRNLLIYLEAEVQQRVLGLLHFGLREGGALFLGTTESVAGAEDLFEPIDKRARIFRRVGPTRHGAVEFPLPHSLGIAAEGGGPGPPAGEVPRPRRRDVVRPSLAQLTQRALLEAHTPPAVTVDLDGRILYYHGDTRPFLQQLSGEPTRDVLLLAREGIRGAVRVALQRAAAQDARVDVPDGWVDLETGRRVRVAVTTSPVVADAAPGERDDPADYFVVSFAERGDVAPPAIDRPAGEAEESIDERRRLRAELQSTIEELQTSNEELTASHQEAMSINEELQSANEELETSKEEMQSLNEELTTVNAQLRAKMEEHRAASNDLASLLASTDIAVLFLDPGLRIRRYTPAVRDLVDMIAGDIGRPLGALARRFEDPNLDDDTRAVLDRLIPVEREVAGVDGRHYLRRVTPYRTTDNRIDGVVIAFVDISARKRAEESLRASEEQFRRAVEDAPIPVIMQTEDGQVLQISRTWTELTGYTLADLPTAEAWLTRAYGPGADAVRAYMHELFRGDRKALGVEFAIRARDGSERQWSFSASAPGSLRDGRRFLVGMALDVTDRRRAEAVLRESEERLRLIVASASDYAIFTLDPGRRVTSWSPGAESIFGYAEAEIVGRSADLLFTPEDRAAGAPESEVRTALREGRAADERWHLRMDGTRFYASGVLTRMGEDGSRGFAKVCSDLTGRKRMEDALREARDDLERRVVERTAELARANESLSESLAARTELLRRVVTAQEEERRRISRELHDSMGQELTALILGLKALERTVPDDAPGRGRLLEVEAIVNRIGREAHDLAVDLRPTALDDLGLGPALAAYVALWSERTGVAAEFQPLGLEGHRLPPEVETAVYRIVQEALNNVAKHAAARHASVIVEQDGGELTALVEDDGRGFDPERAGPASGRRSLGLLGMRERVGLVGGMLLVESAEGGGTTVRVRIPLRPPAEEARHDG
jgi:PAS domain S-box-containing protein